jgi:hypothetical protein
MSISKNGRSILSLAQWKDLAPPKAESQWTDDRSAKEVARAWLGAGAGNLPNEIASAIRSHADFGRVLNWKAEPEAKLRFDAFPGEPRNTDLAVDVRDIHGDYFLAVEAKADEPFAETVAQTLAAALERKLKNPRSNGMARVEHLAAAILGPRGPKELHVADVRYQLLTACAGALREAERKRVTRAVLLVHEFVTSKTDDENHRRNAKDLDRFVQRLSHDQEASVPGGSLVGPFTIPGRPLLNSAVKLYVGKATRVLRTGGV